MLHRRGIAVLIAGLLVGTQVGIAAIDLPEAEVEESEELAYVEPAPSQAEALPEADQAERADQDATASLAPESGYVLPAAPANLVSAPTSDVFPRSADELEMLPALAAYLDRKAATTVPTGAPGPVFPESADELPMLPAMVAYFDRLEATRMAGTDQGTTRSEASEVSVVSAVKDFVKGLFTQPDSSGRETPDNVGMADNGSSGDSDI